MKLIGQFPFVFWILSLFSRYSYGSYDSGETQALQALYFSAVTSVPFTLSGWNNESNPCTDTFYGVSCSNGRIVSLDLEGLSMAGTLPVSVGSPSICCHSFLTGRILRC